MNITIPHQEEYNNLTCHIVGLNPISKKELIEELNKKVFNPIDLDEINQQRDLARKEWNKRLSMYESISNESTSPAAGAGGGSINEVIEYLTWIYISGDDLEYKVMSFSPSSI